VVVVMVRGAVFQFCLPAIQVTLFCLAIGKPPRDLNLCIHNGDVSGGLADRVIGHLSDDNPGAFDLHFTDSMADAVDAVQHGTCWAALDFPTNYTAASMERFMGGSTDPTVLTDSTVTLRLDESDQQIAIFIAQAVQNAFAALLHELFPKAQSPLDVGPPIFGPTNPTFTAFIAPGYGQTEHTQSAR
jgi:hypothetical protein